MYEHNSRGHPGFNKLRREHGMTTVDAGQLPKCHHCLKWNAAAAPTKKKRRKKKEEKVDSELPLSEVHGDIAYLTVGTWDKEHYFQILVDVKPEKYGYSCSASRAITSTPSLGGITECWWKNHTYASRN